MWLHGDMAARLVVSLSGLTGRTMGACAALADELDARGVPATWLIPPRAMQPVVFDYVQRRVCNGDCLALHGFGHPALRRGLWPAGLSALPAHEAGLRLTAARAVLDGLGLRTHCFVPARWLASTGLLTALRLGGFRICAGLKAVYDVRSDTHRDTHRGRVLGFGRGESTEPWWCFALVLGAGRIARRGGLVRLAANADDLRREGPRQALLDAVDIALHHQATPTTYGAFARPLVTRTAPALVPDDALWSQTA